MTAAEPTILATCGGLNPGSWTDSVYGPLLMHAIELARVEGRPPRVAHVNTAGGDQRSVEGPELEAARAAGVDASHIRFFPHRNILNLRAHVLAQDVIWVSGGSVVNLLAVWRAHGLDGILREAWQAGVVLAGGSAGALCWHEGGTTASFGPQIEAVADGLGILPGSLGVHYDSDPQRRVAHEAAVASGSLPPGYALDEGVGLVYGGTRLLDVVSERDGQYAWRVEALDGRAVETRIKPRLLPGATDPESGFDPRPTSDFQPTSDSQPTLEEA
ncbi:Type 1 glutamine amidotransferase-like domain-containing protein [Leifsonia poae]|uniref:Type 1 glutamine amidotransferase-like domain-containing protein n=1 Tax=Leifsonia poae TaxID=110933 RepID=UPI003D66CB89